MQLGAWVPGAHGRTRGQWCGLLTTCLSTTACGVCMLTVGSVATEREISALSQRFRLWDNLLAMGSFALQV